MKYLAPPPLGGCQALCRIGSQERRRRWTSVNSFVMDRGPHLPVPVPGSASFGKECGNNSRIEINLTTRIANDDDDAAWVAWCFLLHGVSVGAGEFKGDTAIVGVAVVVVTVDPITNSHFVALLCVVGWLLKLELELEVNWTDPTY